jgi:hypothetical protein
MSPCLALPASDREGSMTATGQAALGAAFRDVYRQTRPRRVAVVGRAAGNGLQHVDPGITSDVIGIDLAVAGVDLPPGSIDLVHLALVFEPVDPGVVMARAARWLSPAGVCAVVLQRPSKTHAPEAIEALGRGAGLFCTRSWDVAWPDDGRLHVALFGRKRPWR